MRIRRDRRHAIENRDAYRLGYPSGRWYGEHDLKKIVLNVTLPIDTGRLMGDPELDHELHEACGGEHRGFFERQKLDLGGAEHSHQEAKFCWT